MNVRMYQSIIKTLETIYYNNKLKQWINQIFQFFFTNNFSEYLNVKNNILPT